MLKDSILKYTQSLFDPQKDKTLKITRDQINLFLNCPRCFYLDLRLGIKRPTHHESSLESYFNQMLQKEFDIDRVKNITHPLMKSYGIYAKPLPQSQIIKWKQMLENGMDTKIKDRKIEILGDLNDLWINSKGEIIIVDYNTLTKPQELNIPTHEEIGADGRMEIYQWLFKKQGILVSNTGYFIVCYGYTDKEAFDGKLEFDIKIIPYQGNDNWVEKILTAAYDSLLPDVFSDSGENCIYCHYRDSVETKSKKHFKKQSFQKIETVTEYDIKIFEKNKELTPLYQSVFSDEKIPESFHSSYFKTYKYNIGFTNNFQELLKAKDIILINNPLKLENKNFKTLIQRNLNSKTFIIDTQNQIKDHDQDFVKTGFSHVYSFDLFSKKTEAFHEEKEKRGIYQYLEFISRFVRHYLRSNDKNLTNDIKNLNPNQKNLLIIEDDPFLVSLYKKIFIENGYGIIATNDGISGLNIASQYPFDAIISGIMLPWMNGLETIKILKEMNITQKIPIWVYSSLAQDSVIRQAYQFGVTSYLVKSDMTPYQVYCEIEKFLGD